jgi:hypothetical protein
VFDVPLECERVTAVKCIALYKIMQCEHMSYEKKATCGVGLAIVPVNRKK